MRLLLLISIATIALGACNHDNCYRALAGSSASASAFCATYTTQTQTATTGLPVYACSSSPPRLSSACSCVLPFTTTLPATTPATTAPSSTPSPTITAAYRNGDFNQVPYGPSQVNTSEVPWFTVQSTNTTIEYIDYGGVGYASTPLTNHPSRSPHPALSPRETMPIESNLLHPARSPCTAKPTPNPTPSRGSKNPITVHQQTSYTISFLARQTHPQEQHCVVEIGWNASNYGTVFPSQFRNVSTGYTATFQSTYLGPMPDIPDGTFNT